MKSTMGSEVFPPFPSPSLPQQSPTTNTPHFTLNAELQVYIYSGLQFGGSPSWPIRASQSIASHLPHGVTSKAIPGQPRGLEYSVSGQLLGRRPAATVPKRGEVAREGPPGLLHAPSGRTTVAARLPRRRAGSLSPTTARGRWGGRRERRWHLSRCNRTRVS